MRVIFPNFSFEDAIAERNTVPDAALRRIVNSLSPLTGVMGNAGDVVVVAADGRPSEIPDVLAQVDYVTLDEVTQRASDSSVNHTLLPWGWDSQARELAARIGFRTAIPAHESVLEVNSRRFSAEFDVVEGADADVFPDKRFGRICQSFEDLQSGIEHLAAQQMTHWVAKPAWSAAGRSCLPGRSVTMNDNQRGWLRKQLDRYDYVYLEPWLPIIRECGIQLDVSSSDNAAPAVQVAGITELITDRAGRYRGSILTDDQDPFWHTAVEHAKMIGQHAANLGYFGSLGIDSMQIELPNGQSALRLCNDVNGRSTMGRLALRLWQQVGKGKTSIWLHSAVGNHAEHDGTHWIFPATTNKSIVETVRVSPRLIGSRPNVVESSLYVTDGSQAIQDLVQAVRGHVRMQM